MSLRDVRKLLEDRSLGEQSFDAVATVLTGHGHLDLEQPTLLGVLGHSPLLEPRER
jgi:hypothetical protein